MGQDLCRHGDVGGLWEGSSNTQGDTCVKKPCLNTDIAAGMVP